MVIKSDTELPVIESTPKKKLHLERDVVRKIAIRAGLRTGMRWSCFLTDQSK